MRKFIMLACMLLLFVSKCFAGAKDCFIKARPDWEAGAQLEQNLTIGLHAVFDVDDFENAKIYINGEFIGFGPSIVAHGFFRVDQYDLSHRLKLQ